jgi:hypothetical protein
VSDAQPETTFAEDAATWHAVLLRMAGSVPDDLITEARTWLAEGQQLDVAQALAFAAVAGRVPVLAEDAQVIAAELLAAGEDPDVVAQLEIVDQEVLEPSPWWFSPVRVTDSESAAQAPTLIDLSADPADRAALDAVDAAAVDAGEAEPAVSALWRSWRAPVDGSPWPEPHRVFVVTVPVTASDAELPALTARLQEALLAAGEENPQVEVCRDGLPVPEYQSMACAHSALLWAREPAVPIRLARVFDAVDAESGPSFAATHPLIDDPVEAQFLLGYLDAALPVLTTSATMADLLDPDLAEVVPLTFRTDGTWIWTDTVAYYLRRYALAPEEHLLAHVREAGPRAPQVSEVALHRVLAFLQRPDDTEPVWIVPQMSGDRLLDPPRADGEADGRPDLETHAGAVARALLLLEN